jgi:hypothetical protein
MLDALLAELFDDDDDLWTYFVFRDAADILL